MAWPRRDGLSAFGGDKAKRAEEAGASVQTTISFSSCFADVGRWGGRREATDPMGSGPSPPITPRQDLVDFWERGTPAIINSHGRGRDRNN